MMQKLFGDTIPEQRYFLQKKLKISLVLLVLGVLLSVGTSIASGEFTLEGILLFMIFILYSWGWTMLKGLLGIASFASIWGIFVNPVLGMIIIVAFAFLGYIGGFVSFCLGVIRWFQIKDK